MTRFAAFALLVACAALLGCGQKPTATEPTAPAPGPTPAPTPAALSDRDRAQGEWKAVKVEWPEKAGNAPTQKELDDTSITVAGDRATLTMKDQPAETLDVLFTEDATKTPRQVNFIATEGKDSREPRKHEVFGVGKDGKAKVVSTFTHPPLKAIYKFDGDALVIAFPLEPKADRPTAFKPVMLPRKDEFDRETPVVVLHLKKK